MFTERIYGMYVGSKINTFGKKKCSHCTALAYRPSSSSWCSCGDNIHNYPGPPKESVDLHFYGSCGTPWNTFEDFFFKITYILSLICTEVLSVQNVQKKRIKKARERFIGRILYASCLHTIVYKQCTES